MVKKTFAHKGEPKSVRELRVRSEGHRLPGNPPGSTAFTTALYIFYNADFVERAIDDKGRATGIVDDFNTWIVINNEIDDEAYTKHSHLVRRTVGEIERRYLREGQDKPCSLYKKQDLRRHEIAMLWQRRDQATGERESARRHSRQEIDNAPTRHKSGQQGDICVHRPPEHQKRQAGPGTPVVQELRVTDSRLRSIYVVWSRKIGTTRLIKTLEKTQRLRARGFLRVWKAVSLPVLEAEAHLEDARTGENIYARINSPQEASDIASEITTPLSLATLRDNKRTCRKD